MVIPQGMSYANLAGLPYAFGLYGAFVPCIVYAFFGTSRQLVSMPRADRRVAVLNMHGACQASPPLRLLLLEHPTVC